MKKGAAILGLSFAVIMVLILPVLAVDYAPGVSVGQYVKYSNFVVVPTPPVELAWSKQEVVAVSGGEITLRSTGQFENGTASPISGTIISYNVETGRMNDTSYYSYGPIIAGNLSKGDSIPGGIFVHLKVNKTETRTYLGVSRAVNIVETNQSSEHYIIVYDKLSGVTLEFKWERQGSPYQIARESSYSVTQTNIFSVAGPTAVSLPFEALMGVAVIVVVSVVAVTVFALRKRAR